MRGGLVDITGMKFNKLLVLNREHNPRYKHASWLCRCDCGNLTVVVGNNLRNGGTKSCGCSKGDYISNALSGSPSLYPNEYNVYNGMKFRCFNQNSDGYIHYGEKGVTICDRWLESFDNFLTDMGLRPSNEHSIDRIDYDGNYEPGNCRWATVTEQNRNRSNNVVITYYGLTLLMVDWAAAFNLDRRKLRDYLKYSKNFEDGLIRYGLLEQARQVLNNHSSFIIQPFGKYNEFDGYAN